MKRVCLGLVACSGLGLAMLGGCTGDGEPIWNDTSMVDVNSLFDEWSLDSIMGESVGSWLPEGAKLPTMQVAEDGRVSGQSTINRWMSKLDLESLAKGNFDLGDAATTQMAGSQAAMDAEQQFMDALSKVKDFDLSGDGLTLLNDAGQQLLSFVRG